jgi:hypothetical protein
MATEGAQLARMSAELLARPSDKRSIAPVKHLGSTSVAWLDAVNRTNLFSEAFIVPLRQALFGLDSQTDRADLIDMNNADDKAKYENLAIVGVGFEIIVTGDLDGVPFPADYCDDVRRAIGRTFKMAALPQASKTEFHVYWTDLGLFDRRRGIDFQGIPPTVLESNAGRIQVGMNNTTDGDLSAAALFSLPPTTTALGGILNISCDAYFRTILKDDAAALFDSIRRAL